MVVHGKPQRFRTEELREMLENEMHAMKLAMADFKREMVYIEDAFHEVRACAAVVVGG
jgi:hypothetical protein